MLKLQISNETSRLNFGISALVPMTIGIVCILFFVFWEFTPAIGAVRLASRPATSNP